MAAFLQLNKNKNMSKKRATRLRECSVDLEHLRQILNYDAITGVFTWKVKVAKKIVIGSEAGWTSASKVTPDLVYRYITVNRVKLRAHRLAWAMSYGSWPVNFIDHVNGDGEDNRLCNLREATASENLQNKVNRKVPLSGVTGASWHVAGKCWESRICIGRKSIRLGLFPTAEAAGAAYLEAKAKVHPFNPVPRALAAGGSVQNYNKKASDE